VAIIGENHPNWAICVSGNDVPRRGGCAASIPSAPVEALANFLENSESKLTFVSPTNLEKFGRGCEAAGPAHQRRQAATRERLGWFA